MKGNKLVKLQKERISFEEFREKINDALKEVLEICSDQEASIGLFINRKEINGPDQDVFVLSNIADEQMLCVFMGENIDCLLNQIKGRMEDRKKNTIN